MNKEMLIGKTKEEAEKICKEKHVKYRYYSIDGDRRALTTDYWPNRVNLTVENNIVTDVHFG